MWKRLRSSAATFRTTFKADRSELVLRGLMRVLISGHPRFVFSRSLSMFILAFWALLLRIDIIGKAFISLGFYLYFIAQLLFGFRVASNRCGNIADSRRGNMVMYRLDAMLYAQCKPIRRSIYNPNRKQKTENAEFRRERSCFQCKEQENRIKWGIYKNKCQ